MNTGMICTSWSLSQPMDSWGPLLVPELDYFSRSESMWPIRHGGLTMKCWFVLKILAGMVGFWYVFGPVWGVLPFCSVLTTAGIAIGRNQLSRCKPWRGGERGRAMTFLRERAGRLRSNLHSTFMFLLRCCTCFSLSVLDLWFWLWCCNCVGGYSTYDGSAVTWAKKQDIFCWAALGSVEVTHVGSHDKVLLK